MAGRRPIGVVTVIPCYKCGTLTANGGRWCTKCLNEYESRQRAIHAVRSMLPADHPMRRGPVY